MITAREENAIIDRVLGGDRQSYATLVDTYKSYAFTIALKIINNRAEAEEAAQDAFVKAFHHLKSFNRQARFSTWLYRIVFNTAISYKRKNRPVFESVENAHVEFSERADSEIERDQKQVYLAKAMDRLLEADRVAIQLFYLKEFSLDEVADMMKQNANTVKVRVHRARLRLAEELKKILNEEALTL